MTWLGFFSLCRPLCVAAAHVARCPLTPRASNKMHCAVPPFSRISHGLFYCLLYPLPCTSFSDLHLSFQLQPSNILFSGVILPSCNLHRARSIVHPPSCTLHGAPCIIHPPLCALHLVPAIMYPFIEYFPSCTLHHFLSCTHPLRMLLPHNLQSLHMQHTIPSHASSCHA